MMENFVFCQNSLMLSSFCVFEDMRDKNELIDFRLEFDDRTFQGHRIVLAAAIPYFRDIFSSKREDIVLDGVDPDALEAIINFAYKGNIEISYENVLSLISATKVFRLRDVYNCCCKFLEERMDANNVWKIRTFAETQNCSKIMSISDQYIKQNFEAFSESASFKDVPLANLKEIISEDDLKVTTEEKVFEAVLRWVKFSPVERRGLLRDLLLSVRMSQLSFDYLEERALPDEQIQTIECCKKLVEEAKFCYLVPETIPRCSFTIRPRTFEIPKCQEKDAFGLYAVCDSESGISVKFLNTDDQKWTPVSRDEIKHLHKVSVFGARIYIFLENTVKFLYVKTRTWRSLDTYHESLLMSAAVYHRKNIYFFGGPHKGSDIIRCYSTHKNEWLEEYKMKRCVDFPGATSLGDFIYVTGGCLAGTVYKTTDRYNPDTKTWEAVASMLSRRYSHGCTSVNGKIYVCGGSDDTAYLNTVEEYDPETNRWKFVDKMRVPRTAFSVVAFDGKIYALGGTTERGTDPAGMEVYDPCYNRWKAGASLPDNTKCEIYLVKAKVPGEIRKKVASVESLTSVSSRVSMDKKKRNIPVCNFCGKPGHMSPDCWHKLCYNCGGRGHTAAKCTKNNKDDKNDVKCSQCGKTGHCEHDLHFGNRKNSKCFACGGIGHFARDCPSCESFKRTCYSCGGTGHTQEDCKKHKKTY